ncbi:MAG TPA: hypothetical protein VG649_14375 [Candidatus Angelobacter sp.]|jgi:hypothetical protein|nr:hypothetical protein [Candidatus Angelobacter sp.]
MLSASLIAIAICPQAAAKVHPKQLTQSQLRQFVHCFLRTEINTAQYGRNVRFRYRLAPPEYSEDGIIFAVIYRAGTLKQWLFVAFGPAQEMPGTLRRQLRALDQCSWQARSG